MTKHCPRCGEETKGTGIDGRCRSCAQAEARDRKQAERALARHKFNRRPEGYSEPSLPRLKFLEDVE